jgi:hypothetical protein
MTRAIDQVGTIDPERSRASVAERYDVAISASGHEQVHRRAIQAQRARPTLAPEIAPVGERLHVQPRSGQ